MTLNVPDEQGGFRPATGIGQKYRIDEATAEISGLDSAAFTPDGDGETSWCPVMPSEWIPKPCCG